MAYGFETDDFVRFASALRDYPQGLPDDPERLRELSELYIAAAAALFLLMQKIMEARLEASPRGQRYSRFLPIYIDRVEALIEVLRDFLLNGLEQGEIGIVADFLEGVRRGAIAEEMVALQFAVDASSGESADANADEAAGTTVTNSLKKQIERHVKIPFVNPILHAINEILSVARGVA